MQRHSKVQYLVSLKFNIHCTSILKPLSGSFTMKAKLLHVMIKICRNCVHLKQKLNLDNRSNKNCSKLVSQIQIKYQIWTETYGNLSLK